MWAGYLNQGWFIIIELKDQLLSNMEQFLLDKVWLKTYPDSNVSIQQILN